MKTLKSLFCLFALAGVVLLPSPLPAKDSPGLSLARQLNQAFIEVADKVSPSVVVIRVAHKPGKSGWMSGDTDNPFFDFLPKQFREQFEEEMQKRRERSNRQPRRPREPVFDGQGSGIIIREDGYILTNRHVVDEADKIKVRLKDGTEYDAEVRGVDAQSDVAVLKIKATGLPALKFADSAKTRVGEFAIAIGAPFSLDYSVTFGHVSAKGRHVLDSRQMMDQDFIQTDANINPGNSGGPLVNIDGEIIGINTLIRGMNSGIGFAIPANLAREVADKLISDGRYARSWLGVGILGLREYAEFQNLVKDVKDGVVVRQIDPAGPAAKSDLKPSDIITAVDGRPVATAQELKNEVRAKKIGQPITLDVVRANKPMKIKVSTGEYPDELTPVVNKTTKEEEQFDLGLTVKTLTRELAEEYSAKLPEDKQGVIITAVEEDGPAARKGIKPGDIITEVNQKKIASTKQFRDALKQADAKKGVIVSLVSDGVSKFEVLRNSTD
ncbi:MAG: trypsin-like peptidase domain-containing protein [Verrucomicrobia bacterium]|nr:trypsin-like peptidase domain-containing protein [Verrucomicrobiota bacterium]